MEMMQVPIHMCPDKMFKSLGGKQRDFADTVLMCGQRHRVDMILDQSKNVKKVLGFSGYSIFKANYEEKDFMIANSGMYCPDTAIVMELLLCGGVKNFIRLGSCGSLDSKICIGDIVLADSVIRGDGTSSYYVDDDYKAKSSEELINMFKGLLNENAVYCGPVWTTDALFREIPDIVDPIIRQGAIAIDMVTSIVLTLAQIRHVNAVSVLAVSDVVVSGKSGFKDPAYKKAEETIIAAALNYIKSC